MRITQDHVLFFTKHDWPSNWWRQPYGAYSCSEQAFMARKARFFGDDETLAEILGEPDPARQKALGRKVKGFDEDAWNAAAPQVMYEVQVEKYGALDDLRAKLVDLRAKRFVEASPYDRIWGIGLEASDPRAMDPRLWRGRNLLGLALDATAALYAERGKRAARGLAPLEGDIEAHWQAALAFS